MASDKCPICGEDIGSNGKFCSKECFHESMRERVDVECGQCGEMFEVKPAYAEDRRFCSPECSNRHRDKKVVKICNTCGDEFKVKRKRKDSAKYCSTDCTGKALEDKVLKQCPVCCEEFKVFRSQKDYRVTCSKECQAEYMSDKISGKDAPNWSGGKVKSECSWCSKEFNLYPSELEHSQENYCSENCKYSHLAERQSGSGHWNWNKNREKVNLRSSAEYTKWRAKVVSNVDSCEECGKSNTTLQAHHIVPISEDKTKATDLDNGKALCSDCHSDEHPDIPDGMFDKGLSDWQ